MTTLIMRSARARHGFTIAELMIAMTIFGVVLTAAVGFLVSQSKGFRLLANRSAAVQNGRYGRDVMRQEIRTAGTNVTEEQPLIVFANDSTFAFNADLTTNRRDSIRYTGAVYVDTYAADAEVQAPLLANAITIPGSSPGFSYPLAEYSQAAGAFIDSDAELIIFRFLTDTTTGAAGTYILTRQVNNKLPDVVASGISKSQSKPFFRYWYDPAKFGAVSPNIDTIPRSWLPLAKTVAKRGVLPDTGIAITTRIDALRSVEVTYEVTPPKGANREVVRYMVPLPNIVNARQSRACGRAPITPTSPTAVWNPDTLAVFVTWAKDVDDGGGEKDALRYVLWRQVSGATTWGTPITTIGVSVGTSYSYKDQKVSQGSGIQYKYALAVQDCTPTVSTIVTSGLVTVP